jgi:preprotein translocase subunit SecE
MRLEEGEVAESKRRSEDAVDDRLDEDLGEDEYTDDDTATAAVDGRAGSPSGTATRVAASRTRADAARRGERSEPRLGLWGRLRRFILEVVAEMRKVIWPTRKELITYTTVVVIFVAVVMTLVALLDWAFAHGVLWVFGGAKK